MTKSFTLEFPHVERYFWTIVDQPNFHKIIAKPKEAKKEVKKEEPKCKAEEPAEEEEAPKPKPRNPLDLLPPKVSGIYNDPEGYSIWFYDYKYNDENTVSFVTLNKVGGFLQRMDLARKYAFGKMLVIGSDSPYKVKGLWLFRGKDIPHFVLDQCYVRYGALRVDKGRHQ
ncbi:hypothetical protein IEQ34_018047 [Dendrobium chrysotoxum]|uniref:EF-1-gamma C-terminal domain-containing protein n=1 Tax=Dendrobium chrysotoxum TaxID=161865 RepID=A0AAV7FUR7_DENCH|nr:hypothetical protein IEQ34_017698 [Dendrobium chrysotoxum]KAH0453723.1 hypothetical protein IEQ34_018047 [Dendrobium chrysotoxum]